MNTELKVVARMVAAPGRAEGLVPAMETLVAQTRREPGCIAYELFRGTDNPDVLIFAETWESRAHWEAHMAGDAIRAFNGRIGSGNFASGEVHPLTLIA